METPFTEWMRPRTLNEVAGQEHIVGRGQILDAIIKRKKMTNLIFYGPPGTGKTTVAKILSEEMGLPFRSLNATYSNTQDIRNALADRNTFFAAQGIIIYIDEIHNFNKKQQQLLLEQIEMGEIYLIASTTENPYHSVYKSLLSRCMVLEFLSLKDEDIQTGVEQVVKHLREEMKVTMDPNFINDLIAFANGDLRKAIQMIGLIKDLFSDDEHLELTRENLQRLGSSHNFLYDRNGDEHYDLLSALQKSIRGSDVDASLHYMARLIEAGDLQSICRRLLVIASEDIGLAYPAAISIVKACVDSAFQLGFPEARIVLAQACVLLASAPKSNTAYMAMDKALQDLREHGEATVPNHLKDSHYQGAGDLNRGVEYKYPHSYPFHYVAQQYLPDALAGRVYYEHGDNKMEEQAKAYRDFLRDRDSEKHHK